MHYGVAWYPEHWPESRWPEDLRLMRDAGINLVRIADFAWSTIEPREGEYRLDLFERAITAAAEHGMEVIIATPTASPPAWLTTTYPEVLAVTQDGVRHPHGGRCHYSVASPTYRHLSRQVAARMGERFGQNPHVIGWQIDNEYNRVSYDEGTRRAFQEWLRARYETLDALNERWWTVYW
ncbi:MAG TPA: beta-galactosidase, partial [Deinococcales bacterium]|nr:beta-galactosidase [Deinococcales bacterium]